MVLVIQAFIDPEAYPDHIQRLAVMFLLRARGVGKFSLDDLIAPLHG